MKTIKIVKPLRGFSMKRASSYRVLTNQQKLNLCHLVERLGLFFKCLIQIEKYTSLPRLALF